MSPESQGRSGRASLSKSWMKQLRVMSFRLLVIALGCLMLGAAWKPDDVALAQQQIQDIIEISNSWNERWTQQEAETALSHSSFNWKVLPAPANREAIQFTLNKPGFHGPSSGVLPLTFEEPNWTIDKKSGFDASVEMALSAKPTTLAEFHKFWDLLDQELQIKVPRELEAQLEMTKSSISPVEPPYSAAFVSFKDKHPQNDEAFDQKLFPAYLRAGQVKAASGKSLGLRYEALWAFSLKPYTGQIPEMFIAAMPVAGYDALPFDGQAHFINIVRSKKQHAWRRGSYQEAFAALYGITREYENVDLETAKRILDSMKSHAQ